MRERECRGKVNADIMKTFILIKEMDDEKY